MGDNLFYSLAGPLDAIPTDRQVRTANLIGFAPLVRQLGGDPRAILERHGMDPRDLRNPDDYMNCQSLVDLFEYCSISLNDPLFGIRMAQHQEPDVFGCVTALCRAAPTFRDAMNCFIDYLPVAHSPATILELVEAEDIAELRWGVRPELGLNTQAHYQGALLDLKLLRQLVGPNFRASYVNMAADTRSKDIPELENKLGCRFHSRSSSNAIAFPREYLDYPVASASRTLHRLISGYLDRVKAASRTTIVERVEDYIRGALPLGSCSIEHCARKLGTSIRTLQAQLSDHKLQFSEILATQRIVLAKSYLEQGHLSLDEVAVLLGYSEQSSFGRAFKRWTNTTPQNYRAMRGMPVEQVH